MDLFGLGGRAFRARLKQELPAWRRDGILDAAAAGTLRARYQLDEEGLSVATAAIYTLGVLLLGGGMISLVAWNWAELSKPLKLSLLTGALVAAHGSGYWLWRVSGRMPRLGHALILLGTLIFGADIGLLSQVFHISTDPSAGLAAWAIGAAVAAWVLPSVPNGVVAVVVTCLWAAAFLEEHDTLRPFIPYLVAVPFLSLAWRTASRPLFLVATLGTLWCMAMVAGWETEEAAGVVVSLVAGAVALLAFALHGGERPEPWRGFTGTARAVGLLLLVSVAYVCSFHDLAEELAWKELAGAPTGWVAFAAPAALLGLALFVLARRRGTGALRSQPASRIAFGGGFLLLLALALPGDGVAGAVAGNVILAAISIAAVTSSARTLERAPFWWGALLGGLVIFTRFLEFQTELWLKAIAFLACGVAVIFFGKTFERRRRAALGQGPAAGQGREQGQGQGPGHAPEPGQGPRPESGRDLEQGNA